MNNRDLKLIISDFSGIHYAEFNKFINGQAKKVTLMITEKEYNHAKELIDTNDLYGIDNFCYSIA